MAFLAVMFFSLFFFRFQYSYFVYLALPGKEGAKKVYEAILPEFTRKSAHKTSAPSLALPSSAEAIHDMTLSKSQRLLRVKSEKSTYT